MRLPILSETTKMQSVSDTFSGYNHNLKIGDGEFYDMENMTSDIYPILSPRKKRGLYYGYNELEEDINAIGIISKENVCCVDGTDFVIIGKERINMGLDQNTQKTLVSMGAYVIILPDKKYINTKDTSDRGDIDVSNISDEETTFSLCKADGTLINITYKQSTTPTSATDGQYWLDTSTSPNYLKQFAAATNQWISVLSTYIKIEGTNIGKDIGKEDGVKITITKSDDADGKYIYDGDIHFNSEYLDEIDGFFSLIDSGNNYVVITGIIDQTYVIKNKVTVAREMPKMDFIIESNNRLWGCRYGLDNYGKTVNQIYASKLGEFKNWTCYGTKSTDSYYVDVGTDGEWTGAINYLGYPTFFKENHIHKVFGNYPSNYQVQETACRGVQAGSGKSIAIVNEVLFYKSDNGVCAYSGSLPTEVSYQLGNERYKNAVGCSFGNKYYISMQDKNDVYHLFYYDTSKGIWIREDNTKVNGFCEHRNDLYYIDDKDKKIKSINGSGDEYEDSIQWYAETGIIGMGVTAKKYVARMNIRMSLDIGTRVWFFIDYDSSGNWENVCSFTAVRLLSFDIPIRPKRCDHFRLKIVGDGGAKIFSIARDIEQGSDV